MGKKNSGLCSFQARSSNVRLIPNTPSLASSKKSRGIKVKSQHYNKRIHAINNTRKSTPSRPTRAPHALRPRTTLVYFASSSFWLPTIQFDSSA